jgi:hypothetical protein
MIRMRTSTGTAAVANVRVRGASAIAAVATARVRDGSGLRTVFAAGGSAGGLTVSAAPALAYGAAASGGEASASTQSVTVTVTGGSGALSYAWTTQDSDGSWSIDISNGPTTRFTALTILPGQTSTATFRCTVTDQSGRSGFVDVPATADNYGRIDVPY